MKKERKINELLAIVGMSEEARFKYPHEFSGGQKQRIGIARAIASNPKLIIADEPVSALDLSVQAQVLNFLKDIQDEFGLSYLFISHDLGVVKHMCDNISIMYKGRFVESGNRKDIYKNPQHIYTKRLLSAIPEVNPTDREERKNIRRAVEADYLTNHHNYYDENGRVYDLQPISDTHQVATMLRAKGACNMWKTIVRRILVMIPQLFVLSLLIFHHGEIYAWGPFYRTNYSRNRSCTSRRTS